MRTPLASRMMTNMAEKQNLRGSGELTANLQAQFMGLARRASTSSLSFTGAPGILLSGGSKLHLRVMDAVMVCALSTMRWHTRRSPCYYRIRAHDGSVCLRRRLRHTPFPCGISMPRVYQLKPITGLKNGSCSHDTIDLAKRLRQEIAWARHTKVEPDDLYLGPQLTHLSCRLKACHTPRQ